METPRWQRLDAAAAPGGDSSGNASGGGPTPELPPAAPPPPPVMPPPPPGAPVVAPTEPSAEAKPAEPEPVAQVVQAAAAPVPDSPPPPVAAAVPVAEVKPAAIAPSSEATGTSTTEASDGPPSTSADAATGSAQPPDGGATPAADDNKAAEAELPKAEADGDEKPAEPEAAAGDSKPTEPEASGDEAGAPTPATPTPTIAPPVPAVPLGTRIRQYLDHSYTHDGSATAATHAFVISWLVVVSLLLLVIEGAPEFRTFSDGQEVVATETVEPTATPELLVQVRAVVQEEISRSRSLGNAVVELPTVTPQPTAEPTPTPTAEEAAKAAEVTREPWFTMPAEAEGSIHFSFVLLEGIIAVLFTIDYVLNARYEKRWRDYVLGPWGIIDLVAILPFFVVLANYLGLMGEGELPTWVVFLQGLRILRAIKLFRVVSETKTENALGEVVEGSTLHRDILFGCLTVFGAVAILEVFGWTADRNLFWLFLGMASAITVAFRRWCMHSERGGASALVVVASLIIGTALSVAQDRAGDQSVAEWTAVYTVLFVTVSWLQIEAKEGAL